ncbi:zinc metalloprotease HtpX [Catenuloplanes atrovinosus]|uniref:Protease HtpX homolog n=1 Tax=Catenuloplanes atrovinosus TaxID=137266 RepID=A0AAE3YVW8_9ACTN|nr:zinc metalloprotease HtpX [Catenuloplanes atrovinosus]MDR7279505.1 heat shock protein HtpX [Catenuloplanes atrovinosus]
MHSHHNGLKTAALLGLLTAMILGVGYWFGGSTGLVVAVLLSLGMNAAGYFWSDRIALRSMRARPVSEAEFPALYQMVRELATEAGQPMPRLYVSPALQPNAFATGRNPRNAAVAVTVGITRLLDYRELRAVIGHELSHVYNRDILISSVAAGLAGIITMLANLAIFIPLGGGDDEDAPNPAALLLMIVLGPIAASIIQLAISRNREFEADASGARLTRDPLALADALRKISYGTQRIPLPADTRVASSAHLMIANPLTGGGLSALFSTHPPMDERIRRLQTMAVASH